MQGKGRNLCCSIIITDLVPCRVLPRILKCIFPGLTWTDSTDTHFELSEIKVDTIC